MKHAGDAALDALEPLIVEIRTRDQLKEKKRGVFYRKGKAALHFHEDPAGLFADLRTPEDWDRFGVDDSAGRAALLTALDALLLSPAKPAAPRRR